MRRRRRPIAPTIIRTISSTSPPAATAIAASTPRDEHRRRRADRERAGRAFCADDGRRRHSRCDCQHSGRAADEGRGERVHRVRRVGRDGCGHGAIEVDRPEAVGGITRRPATVQRREQSTDEPRRREPRVLRPDQRGGRGSDGGCLARAVPGERRAARTRHRCDVDAGRGEREVTVPRREVRDPPVTIDGADRDHSETDARLLDRAVLLPAIAARGEQHRAGAQRVR